MRKKSYIYDGYLSESSDSGELLVNDYDSKLSRDIYHYLISSSWLKIFLCVITLYFLINLVFAFFYWIIPNSISHESKSFYDAFFFSIQTFSTIGYGSLSPTGIPANILVTFQSAIGIISVALITGIVFSKFSKPTANIIFSNKMILSKIDGKTQLSFRMGNMRANDIVQAKVVLSALIDEVSDNGSSFRKIYDLKLRRSNTPFFKLTWTLFHSLEENSPIFTSGEIRKDLRAIAVTVTGHDSTFSTTIFARHLYTKDMIEKNKFFKDIMYDLPDGRIKINYEDFNTLV